MKSSSYPEDTLQKDCFPNENDKCYEIWKTITCHLAYPKCVENNEKNKLHTAMPLCRSYCQKIKNITDSCPILKECDQSHFIHQFNDKMDCSKLDDTNCISAGEYISVS